MRDILQHTAINTPEEALRRDSRRVLSAHMLGAALANYWEGTSPTRLGTWSCDDERVSVTLTGRHEKHFGKIVTVPRSTFEELVRVVFAKDAFAVHPFSKKDWRVFQSALEKKQARQTATREVTLRTASTIGNSWTF
jgi:hypothetical protein